jgi:hypothetical protein
MARLKVMETLLQGRATPEGTQRFQNGRQKSGGCFIDRFQETPSFFARLERISTRRPRTRYTSTATALLKEA